jgi:hypothetical protein
MADDPAAERAVSFTRGAPETVLPALAPEVTDALTRAPEAPAQRRRAALEAVAARWPRCLEAWAELARLADSDIERYAFARVGYHRGLDALRAAGWRGSGLVRWSHESNRGFLSALDQLRQAAAAIGEADEEERCALFLAQLDPGWGRRSED